MDQSKFFIYFFLFFILNFINAQTLDYWTWISGSNSINQGGIYGSKGIASSSNIPGAHYLSISWIDSNNNLWLFGGYGYTTNNTEGNK